MTATLRDAPELRGSDALVRDPWLPVSLGVLLPFGYATWWFRTVAGELRDFGHDVGDEQLSRVSAGRSTVGMLVGWILVVPAVVVIVSTARRLQRAEGICFGTPQPVNGVVATVVAAQTVALACVLAGWAILVPAVLLASAVIVMRLLQPRLNAIWTTSELLPVRPDEEWESLPLLPPSWTRARDRLKGEWHEIVEIVVAGGLVVVALVGLLALGRFLAAEDRTGSFVGFLTAVAVTGLLAGGSLLIGSALRQRADGRWVSLAPAGAVVAAALISTVTAAAWLWTVRPAFHGVLMPLYQWPLVTWIPLVLGLLFTLAVAASGRMRTGIIWRSPVTFAVWGACMIALPGLQGHALYAATDYTRTDLPPTTQPRLLPKVAALAFGSDANLHDAHLVVDPASDRLVWSAEETKGTLRPGPSQGVRALALDSVNGTSEPVARGFDPAVSSVGPGSLQWRAYDRHYLTRVQDAVLIPGAGGEAVAVAPYLRYTGFPVRHAVWAGVYVYHQDGHIEDLTPQQALARAELAGSGRLYPERLARAVASAHGYKSGPAAVLLRRPRTEIDDPSGNPQPYLTNLGDNEVRWVTVAHPARDDRTASAVFLTDSASGATSVWTPPRGTRLLSNAGAVAVTKRLPLVWDTTDDNDDIVWVRKAVEPTPVFAKGHLYYVVSIVANPDYVDTPGPVEQTVVVDAVKRRIVKRFDDDDPAASESLMAFFNP